MAISTKKDNKATTDYSYTIRVVSARVVVDEIAKKFITFSMSVNGVIINECSYNAGKSDKTGKEYEFITLPKREYIDREGNKAYANYVYFPIKDYEKEIIKSLEEKLNE